jgi:hypothetical protein
MAKDYHFAIVRRTRNVPKKSAMPGGQVEVRCGQTATWLPKGVRFAAREPKPLSRHAAALVFGIVHFSDAPRGSH